MTFCSFLFSIRIYRQYTTKEEHRSVRKLWSFYYRFIGLKCHNYALYLCFVYKKSNTPKLSYVTLSRIMLHINFGPSLDTKHLRERRNLELKYKKLSKTQSDIVFLSKCKKFDIVPNGLKLNNPFNSQSTSVKNKGRNICVKAEQRLRNAAINDAYKNSVTYNVIFVRICKH